MELKQLIYFQVCAEQQSLTRAAEILFTSQPHVSMVIRSLEKELGVKLFNRKSKGVELSHVGRQIFDYAINIIKTTDLISATALSAGRSCLQIATNPSSNMAVLLSRYYKKNCSNPPRIDYTECGIEEMLALIAEKKADLGFIFVAENKQRPLNYLLLQKRLSFASLLLTDVVLYVGPHHPLYGQTQVKAEILPTLEYAQMKEDYFTLEDLLECVNHSSRMAPTFQRAVVTNSDHAMIQLLKETKLANLGSYWLKDVYRQYDFKRISIRGLEKKITFGVISREKDDLTAAAISFLDFVKAALNLEK